MHFHQSKKDICSVFHWFHNLRLPFEYTNPYGYFIAFSIQCATIFVMCKGCSCGLNFFIGTCTFLITIASDIKEEMVSFTITRANSQLETKQQLSEFVDLHSNAKQLSWKKMFIEKEQNRNKKLNFRCFRLFNDSVEIFELIISSFFLWSLLTICSTLLTFQFELVEISSIYFLWLSNDLLAKFSSFLFRNIQVSLLYSFLSFAWCSGHLLWCSFSAISDKIFVVNSMNWMMPFMDVVGIYVRLIISKWFPLFWLQHKIFQFWKALEILYAHASHLVR